MTLDLAWPGLSIRRPSACKREGGCWMRNVIEAQRIRSHGRTHDGGAMISATGDVAELVSPLPGLRDIRFNNPQLTLWATFCRRSAALHIGPVPVLSVRPRVHIQGKYMPRLQRWETAAASRHTTLNRARPCGRAGSLRRLGGFRLRCSLRRGRGRRWVRQRVRRTSAGAWCRWRPGWRCGRRSG